LQHRVRHLGTAVREPLSAPLARQVDALLLRKHAQLGAPPGGKAQNQAPENQVSNDSSKGLCHVLFHALGRLAGNRTARQPASCLTGNSVTLSQERERGKKTEENRSGQRTKDEGRRTPDKVQLTDARKLWYKISYRVYAGNRSTRAARRAR